MVLSAANKPKFGVLHHRSRLAEARDDVRHHALARLYERRAAVDNLIGALERYQQEQKQLRENRARVNASELSS